MSRCLSLSLNLIMFSGKKVTYTTPDSGHSHHAPAGVTSSKLAHDVSHSQAKGALGNDIGDVSGDVTATNVKAWLAEDDHRALLNNRVRILDAAVGIGFRQEDQPSVKLLVGQAVTILGNSSDPMTASSKIATSFNVPHTMGLTLIDFLTEGIPPAAAVVTSLHEALTMASTAGRTVSPTPVASGRASMVAAIATGFEQIKHLSRIGSAYDIEQRCLEARDVLSQYVPSFWFPLSAQEWGALAVPITDFARAMQRVPLYSDKARTTALPTVANLRKIIVSAIADKAMWPQCRFILFGHIGDLYGSHTAPLILQGVDPEAAKMSGEESIGVYLTEAVSTITIMFAQTTESMRSAEPHAIARALIISIDNLLSPVSTSLIDQDWFSITLAKGESAYDFFVRIRTAAARCNKSYADLVERLKVALQVVAVDPATPPAVALGIGNVSGHLPRIISTTSDASSFEMALKREPIFTATLWRKTERGEKQPQAEAGRLPLGGTPGNSDGIF